MTKTKPASSFREDLSELEEITQALEGDVVDLEDALKSFERGNELVAKLKQQLETAQLRVQEIQSVKSEKKGNYTLKP